MYLPELFWISDPDITTYFSSGHLVNEQGISWGEPGIFHLSYGRICCIKSLSGTEVLDRKGGVEYYSTYHILIS